MNSEHDDLAKKAEQQFKKMKKMRATSKKELEQFASSITAKQMSSLMKAASSGGTITSTAGSINKGGYSMSSASFAGFDVLGGNFVKSTVKDPHTDKGVCQESYDQGYEDGLKAAKSKEGDTRIK